MERRAPLIALVLALVAACVSPDEVMGSWQGRHQSELIMSWGPPMRTASDGNGGTVLIYESYANLGQSPGQARTDYFGNVTYTAPQQRGYSRSRMFYVNADGIIYAYKWQGL